MRPRHLVLVIATALFMASCATAPLRTAWRPWSRVLGDLEGLRPGTTLALKVAGETEPLLGSERVLMVALEKELHTLLQRRGFVMRESGAEAVVTLHYRTSSRERVNSTFTAKQSQVHVQSTGSASGSGGQGVAIAAAVARAMGASSSSMTQTTASRTVFEHVVALEIQLAGGEDVWKGESSWEGDDPDLLGRAPYALRLLCAELPHRMEPVVVPALKPDRQQDYVSLEVAGRMFSPPALPNPVWFSTTASNSGQVVNLTYTMKAEHRHALPAVVDLLTMAEYALPDTRKSWVNPTDPQLWRAVTLGGTYLVGAGKTPVKVLVELKGNPNGYLVHRCAVVEDAEYARFQADLDRWRTRLGEFFDLYQ